MSRANQWFVPGDGIAREVITADIQRYLGPDALVRPGVGTGEYEGRQGYWITAYRTLTSQMIQDLKLDSQRWQQEQGRQEAGRGVAYQDSRTHAARQHWGPSESMAREREPPSRAGHVGYAPSEPHYTTSAAPAAPYGSSHPMQSYAQPSYNTQPRTDPYAASGYGQPATRDHPSYPPTQSYPGGYSQPVAQDPYARQPPPPTHGYTTPSVTTVRPGYYLASDGNQYPLSQQPQQPSRGSRRPGQ